MASSPHLNPDAGDAGIDFDHPLVSPPDVPVRLWRPKRALITRAARAWPHGQAMAERCAAMGVEVRELASDRLGVAPDAPYTFAKSTLAIVVAPPSKLKLQPIAPSADWRLDLAEGCPAHCSYCYLAGSLKGAPITRAYANLPEIFDAAGRHLGEGKVTSRSQARAHEGTTYEASCYTDPLGIEHVTGSLSAAIAHFSAWQADAQLRFTTKFDAVAPLLGIAHNRKTRMRVSLNPPLFAKFEGGTAPVAQRLIAMRQMVDAGYLMGLTIAPIIAAEGWREAYSELITDVAAALEGAPDPDLTVELITHRYSAGSKAVLDSWYPGSALDMSSDRRAEKRTKFGSIKHVYDKPTMTELRSFFEIDDRRTQLPNSTHPYTGPESSLTNRKTVRAELVEASWLLSERIGKREDSPSIKLRAPRCLDDTRLVAVAVQKSGCKLGCRTVIIVGLRRPAPTVALSMSLPKRRRHLRHAADDLRLLRDAGHDRHRRRHHGADRDPRGLRHRDPRHLFWVRDLDDHRVLRLWVAPRAAAAYPRALPPFPDRRRASTAEPSRANRSRAP